MADDKRVGIGWREAVDLPEWGIEKLVVKVDSGARTSAIHVENLRELPDKMLHFEVVLSRRFNHKRVSVETPWVRRTRVRSSNGEIQERYVVQTRMVLGPVEKDIELTLVSREGMLVRMLLGRSAIGSDFVVYPDLKHMTRDL